jgi:hypothetical protein
MTQMTDCCIGGKWWVHVQGETASYLLYPSPVSVRSRGSLAVRDLVVRTVRGFLSGVPDARHEGLRPAWSDLLAPKACTQRTNECDKASRQGRMSRMRAFLSRRKASYPACLSCRISRPCDSTVFFKDPSSLRMSPSSSRIAVRVLSSPASMSAPFYRDENGEEGAPTIWSGRGGRNQAICEILRVWERA